MSEPIFTVILNGEAQIFNLAESVARLAGTIRQRLVGISPSAPSNEAAKAKAERIFMGYAAEVIDKQRSTLSLLACAIGDLEALASEIPQETPMTTTTGSYGSGPSTGGLGRLV